MTLLAASVIACLAAMIRGASGFGFALVAAPILAMFWTPEVSTPVILLLDVLLAAMLLNSGVFNEMRWREAIALAATALIGSAIGAFFVSDIPPAYAEFGLNLAVLVSAIAALLNVHARFLDHPVIGSAISFVTGVIIGAFAVGGPLLVAWMLAVRRSPGEIRGTLTLVFTCTDIAALGLRLALGTFPSEVLKYSAILAPAVIIGVYVGEHAFRRVDAKAWRRWVAALLAIVALVGLGRAATVLMQG